MDINRIKREDLGKGSNIKLNVCDTEVDMYWKVAIEVLEVIEENNKKGEPTVMVSILCIQTIFVKFSRMLRAKLFQEAKCQVCFCMLEPMKRFSRIMSI